MIGSAGQAATRSAGRETTKGESEVYPTGDPHGEAALADSELLQLCREGNLVGYERLYRTHGTRMKSIAWNILGNANDAEDAVQEAFLKIHRSISAFQGQSTFATWIYRILVNTCYDQYRSRKARPEAVDLDLRSESQPLHAAPSSIPLKVALEKALSKINPRHREVFLLAEVEGFRHSEIAAILDIPDGTSKSWLFEAKRALQHLLMPPASPSSAQGVRQ